MSVLVGPYVLEVWQEGTSSREVLVEIQFGAWHWIVFVEFQERALLVARLDAFRRPAQQEDEGAGSH